MDISLYIIRLLCILSSLNSRFREYCDYKEAINLSDYKYPSPSSDPEDVYRIAIFGTNDLHGAAFPFQFKNPADNSTFEYGGFQYLARYISILREEWKDRLLWLDGGDQFQGKIESKISNGTIVTEFFNKLMLDGSAIGNHEWDYGKQYLYDRLEDSNWAYLAANIKNDDDKFGFLPKTKLVNLFKVGKVNIGVIGLSTIQTPFTTSGDLTNIKFAEYKEYVENYSKILRNVGANAVVLVSHVGMRCKNDMVEKMVLKLRGMNTEQGECDEGEMKVLLDALEPGLVDAVVSGHVHDVAHHWINGVPVIQSINGGYYSNVIYLAFNSTTKEIIRDKAEIEGPLPTCHKVYDKTLKCEHLTKDTAPSAGILKKFIFHKNVMKADESLTTLFDKWWQEVKVYKVFLASTDFTCKRDREKENPFGNLIADFYKNVAGADVGIINDGSLRSQWVEGDVLVEDVYNMFPFDNYLVSFEMTGSELRRAVGDIQGGIKSFYHTSGLMQDVSNTPSKSLVSVKLFNEGEIENDKVYKIATNDFLAGGGDDFRLVREWYTPINQINHGMVRNIMIDSLKELGEIKYTNLIDENKPRLKIVSS